MILPTITFLPKCPRRVVFGFNVLLTRYGWQNLRILCKIRERINKIMKLSLSLRFFKKIELFQTFSYKRQIAVFLVMLSLILCPAFIKAESYSLMEIVTGRTLITVDNRGEAWYVFPGDIRRYYLGNGQTVMDTIKRVVVPVSNSDLEKIKIGIVQINGFLDSDGDGLWDRLEQTLGTNYLSADSDGDGYADGDEIANNYNPLGPGKLPFDSNISKKYAGYILLQYQNHGEAWYVFPPDNKRYYLGNDDQAFLILTKLALGITQTNIQQVPLGW